MNINVTLTHTAQRLVAVFSQPLALPDALSNAASIPPIARPNASGLMEIHRLQAAMTNSLIVKVLASLSRMLCNQAQV
jgi:hypothetical protein